MTTKGKKVRLHFHLHQHQRKPKGWVPHWAIFPGQLWQKVFESQSQSRWLSDSMKRLVKHNSFKRNSSQYLFLNIQSNFELLASHNPDDDLISIFSSFHPIFLFDQLIVNPSFGLKDNPLIYHSKTYPMSLSCNRHKD